MKTGMYPGRTRPNIPALVAVAFSVLVLVAGCGGPPAPQGQESDVEPEQAAIAVEALTVTRGTLFENVQASGTLAGINEAFVVSETQGLVRKVAFELGDYVDVGQVMVQVDSTIANLNMEQAKQQNETAQLELQVADKLFEQGNASKAELLRARSAASGAKARYETMIKSLRDSSIRAPIAGYIAQKEASAALGNLLTPGVRLSRIVDISSLKLEVPVGENQIGLIEPGAPATVTIPAACDQKTFEATVKAVAAGSDPLTGSFTVVITWANPCPDKIKAGMSAVVTIATRRQEPALLVPSASLIERDGNDYVFTAANGKAVLTPVRIGRRLGDRAEILGGLSENEVVIVSGLSNLNQGLSVALSIVGESGNWQ